jgi:HlyD family secretion protein
MKINLNVTQLRSEPVSKQSEQHTIETQPQTSPLDSVVTRKSSQVVTRKTSWRIRIMWTILILGLAEATIYFATPYVLGPIVVTDVIKRQDVVQTVVTSGLVQTPFRINIGAQVTGKVDEVPIAEGQKVSNDQLLIQLDSREQQEAVRLAQSAVTQSETKLIQLETVAAPTATESKIQAQAALTNAQRTYERAAILERRGFATKASLDEARKARDIAQSQLRSAELQLKSNSSGGADYRNAQAQLAQAEASLKSAQAKLGYYQVRAPRSGTIISRGVEKGNVVQPNATLMVLAPDGETQIVTQIDEVNLSKIRLGEKVTVSADAYPKETFNAAVSYINPSVDPARGSVEVKLAVKSPPGYLRQDMTVSAEIEADRRMQVIAVDVTSIRDLGSANPWVAVVENGHAKKRNITLGSIGDNAVEVISGLKEGEVIIQNVTTSLSDGQNVRISAHE